MEFLEGGDPIPILEEREAPLRLSSQARDKAGRPGFHFHSLRHTGLSAYAVQGATLAELLYRGGHTDVTVALRYQHASAARDRALTKRLSQQIAL